MSTARALRAAAVFYGCLAPAVCACQSAAAPEDCAKMRAHYLDLLAGEGPDTSKMTPDQKAAAREMTLALREGDTTWQLATARCPEGTDEGKSRAAAGGAAKPLPPITKKQADCAVAAKTADAWEACLR